MKDKVRKEAFQMSGEWLLHETTAVRLIDEYAASLHKRIAELEDELQTQIGLVDHMKEVCDEYEKELQMKQKTIDALLDPEY